MDQEPDNSQYSTSDPELLRHWSYGEDWKKGSESSRRSQIDHQRNVTSQYLGPPINFADPKINRNVLQINEQSQAFPGQFRQQFPMVNERDQMAYTGENYPISQQLPEGSSINPVIHMTPIHNRNPSLSSNEMSHFSPYRTPKRESFHEEGSARKKGKISDFLPFEESEDQLKHAALKSSELPLSVVAQKTRILENEPSPDSRYVTNTESYKERQKQIFGMAWLLKACESSPTAVVPRNRIYARYAQVCADNVLTPLSPASFGKLIRNLFPKLTTRRLGMRGQSKYHYCGIRLVDEFNVSHMDKISSVETVASKLESQKVAGVINEPSDKRMLLSLQYFPNSMHLIENSLSAESTSMAIDIPSIHPYLPPDADHDISDTLYSLYKVHCTSVFECLRFMRVRKLFAAFSNFINILTAPVFKFYTSEPILEWVIRCDMMTYKKMAKMVAKLHLQTVPEEVMHLLKAIANEYIDKLVASLQSKVTKNFIIMKQRVAGEFISILKRLIKVNEASQAFLTTLGQRKHNVQFTNEWSQLDLSDIVFREAHVSKSTGELLISILKNEFLSIFDTNEDDTINETETLYRAAHLIAELPGKFPQCNPRFFILMATNLLTAILREISFAGGEEFQSWWVIKRWVDEFFNWVFEIGGYLETDFESMKEAPKATQSESFIDNMHSVDLLDRGYTKDYEERHNEAI